MAVGTNLSDALPELLGKLEQLRMLAEREGIGFEIADYGGLRTESDTLRILRYRDDDWNAAVKADPALLRRTSKEKWRPIAQWGSSMHNYGAAFDVRITKNPPKKSGLQSLSRLVELARTVGLKPGADFGDPPHFELPIGLAGARKRWEETHPQSTIYVGAMDTAKKIAGDLKNGNVPTSVVTVLGIVFFALLVYILVIR